MSIHTKEDELVIVVITVGSILAAGADSIRVRADVQVFKADKLSGGNASPTREGREVRVIFAVRAISRIGGKRLTRGQVDEFKLQYVARLHDIAADRERDLLAHRRRVIVEDLPAR